MGLDGQTVQTIPGLPDDAFALSPSADGTTIAFVTAQDGENHVATIGLDGSGMRVLGPGIEPANLARLFDAFFTTRKDGMGMGLSISRSIVEAHGGRIWATNRDEGGARFHVSLPIAQERPA